MFLPFFEPSHQRKRIVCLSSTRWSFLWQRPQQIMSRLCARHDILYVDPPFPVAEEQVRGISNDESGTLIVKNLQTINDALQIFRPLEISRFSYPDLDSNELLKMNQELLQCQIQKALFQLGWQHPLLWLYDPRNVNLVDQLNPCGVIYDCVDSFRSFSWSHPHVSIWEEALVDRADVVLATSRALYQERLRKNRYTFLVPNAADYKHFSPWQGYEKPADITAISRPRLGFIGAIYEWVDLELLQVIADKSPAWNLVLIGPKQHGLQLPERSNIHWLGQRGYAELPAYVHSFDVALIPFLVNETTQHANPIKFWEYLAAGKPVVSTLLPEIPDVPGVVWRSENHSMFCNHCAQALELVQHPLSRNKIITKARAIAYANSWENRCKRILRILVSHFR